MAYKSLLLAFGVFMAWETRKVKMVSLNDSKYITMSVYNTVFMSIVAFAFSFISDEGTAYILVSFTIIIAVTVVLCLVFIPKVSPCNTLEHLHTVVQLELFRYIH
jgi:gamma-aminobutyric acid type B receptor